MIMGLTKTPTTILTFGNLGSGSGTTLANCTQVDLTEVTQWALTTEVYQLSGVASGALVEVFTSSVSGAQYDTKELTSFEGEVTSEALKRKTVYCNPDALYAKVTVKNQSAVGISGKVISTVQELT